MTLVGCNQVAVNWKIASIRLAHETLGGFNCVIGYQFWISPL